MIFDNFDSSIKKYSILITNLGAIPFISFPLLILANLDYKIISIFLSVYSALIINFICGANWIIVLFNSKKNYKKNLYYYFLFFSIPVIPIILVWLIISFQIYLERFEAEVFYENYYLALFGILFIIILFFDIILYKSNFVQLWWFRMRTLGSLVAGIFLILGNYLFFLGFE